MVIEIEEQQLSLAGITGDSHTPVVDIFRKMAPGFPTPGPADISYDIIPADGSKEGMTHQAIDDFVQNGKDSDLHKLPAALHQVDLDKLSTSTTLATDNNAVGRKQQKPSLSTSQLLKNVILIVAARYNRFLGGLTPLVASSIPLFSRILAAASFVNFKVNHKNDNRLAEFCGTDTSNHLPNSLGAL